MQQKSIGKFFQSILPTLLYKLKTWEDHSDPQKSKTKIRPFWTTFAGAVTRREQHRPPQKIGDPDRMPQDLPATGRTRKVYG